MVQGESFLFHKNLIPDTLIQLMMNKSSSTDDNENFM